LTGVNFLAFLVAMFDSICFIVHAELEEVDP